MGTFVLLSIPFALFALAWVLETLAPYLPAFLKTAFTTTASDLGIPQPARKPVQRIVQCLWVVSALFALQYAFAEPTTASRQETRTVPYRTGAVCSDGKISTATGRGACSWHGGVAYWTNTRTFTVTDTFPDRVMAKQEKKERASLGLYYALGMAGLAFVSTYRNRRKLKRLW